MKWMKERDLLIAQTMAFVQSVTGKMPDADKPAAQSVAFAPPEAPKPAEVPKPIVQAAPMPDIEAILAETAIVAQPPKPIQTAPMDLPGDFQSEIRTRVATFRANQERFNRERAAYCSATLAKVRASLEEPLETPRLDK